MLDCDDIVIFLVLVYPVHVHTAKKTGADTDSTVFLNIFGSQGDSGDRLRGGSRGYRAYRWYGQIFQI